TLWSFAPWVVTAYAAVVVVFIVLENRTPQSTFAWMFLFLVLPVGGLVVYRFAGRGWRAFSQQNRLEHNTVESDLVRDLLPVRARYDEYVARIARERPA